MCIRDRPRTLIIPRHELLKEIYKHDGKTNRKEMEASLARLQFTGIETTIHNEDYRYSGGFGFLDSWGYTERKDVKEFRITLSPVSYTHLDVYKRQPFHSGYMRSLVIKVLF